MIYRSSLSSSFQKDMGDKRDAAMAGLPWPTSVRSTPNPRTAGPTDSEMTDDIGHESFPAPMAAAPPTDIPYAPPGYHPRPPMTSYHHHTDYTHYSPWTPSSTTAWQLLTPTFPRERTVHTIYFKIWDPDTPERSLYVEEINQQGFLRQFDPEYFFHKLTGDQHQANQMSDYWRSHYGLPLKHFLHPIPTYLDIDAIKHDTDHYPRHCKAPGGPTIRSSSCRSTDFLLGHFFGSSSHPFQHGLRSCTQPVIGPAAPIGYASSHFELYYLIM